MQDDKQILEDQATATRKALIISVSDYTTTLQPLDFCKNIK
jgi:hypothetical protein